MNPVLTAVIVLCAIGAVCALLLVFAAKYMSVPVDEKFPAIRGCLPGANCGACGYAGCDGYATALAAGEETKTNKCTAGGADVAHALADACGGKYEAVEEKRAFVKCGGDCEHTARRAEWDGAKTCAAAKLLFTGACSCAYGCIGYGDCASVCPEQAINMINGLAYVNTARCTGCGMCASACPNGVISIVGADVPVKVKCSSRDKGAATRKNCTAGCIGCGLCVKSCPSEAITVTDNLAVIDYEKCIGCGACKAVCPSKCIVG